MEPVFATLELAAKTLVAATGTRISYEGLDNIPKTGGAVLAINHTSYIDWLPAALATYYRGRRIRFMIKAEMQKVKIVDFLIRNTKTIPVDRRAGRDAYTVAVQRLQTGEVVGVFPEATISRSFELKEFKTGAARMAAEAGVPIVPLVVWGGQRIWTKDHPKRLGRNKIPVMVAAGRPVAAVADPEQTDAVLRADMIALLHRVQVDYPHPDGAYWVPRRLGGSAPTPAEAKKLDEAELAERARRADRS